MNPPVIVLESIEEILVCGDFRGFRLSYELKDGYSREHVGWVIGHLIDGTFHVDDFVGPGKGNLGVCGVRDVIRQLKAAHPDIVALKGIRLSGVRANVPVPRWGGYARLTSHLQPST